MNTPTTIALLKLTVNNHPGVLAHVCGLFARRAQQREFLRGGRTADTLSHYFHPQKSNSQINGSVPVCTVERARRMTCRPRLLVCKHWVNFYLQSLPLRV